MVSYLQLAPDDPVVAEATGNALAIARIIAPHVAEVVLAHAKQVRAISHARIKAPVGACRQAGRRPTLKLLVQLAPGLNAVLAFSPWCCINRTRMPPRGSAA